VFHHHFFLFLPKTIIERDGKKEMELMTMMRNDRDGRLSVVEQNERNISVLFLHVCRTSNEKANHVRHQQRQGERRNRVGRKKETSLPIIIIIIIINDYCILLNSEPLGTAGLRFSLSFSILCSLLTI
jgi:hypothetical protein